MTLTECFSHCRTDPKCDAIRVDWFTIPANFTAMKIGCGLRGGIELAKCATQTPISYDNRTAPQPSAVQYTTFAVDAPVKSQLLVAVVSLMGYFPVIRNSGNDWTDSGAPWPGDAGGGLPALLAAMQGEAAFGLRSLRARVPSGSEAHYSMLRYDAMGTGQAALVALNLGKRGTVELDLSGIPPQLLGQRPINLLCDGCPQEPALANHTSIELGDYSYTALVGLQLPRWEPQGYLYNCSATYAPPAAAAEMPLTKCLITCLHDAKCNAVEVEWVQKHVVRTHAILTATRFPGYL